MSRFFWKFFYVACAVGWLSIGYDAATTLWQHDWFIAIAVAVACVSCAIDQIDWMVSA